MSRRAGSKKNSYISDPDRRAYLNKLRTIRNQVYQEHEEEYRSAGLLRRLVVRLRMEREIRRRAEGSQASGR
jgi:hypothetical protein